MNCLLKAAKAKQKMNTVKINFEMNIPHENEETMMFDSDNGNKNWKDAELLELKQIYNFNTFEYLGPVNEARIPPGHTKIQVHLIYDYKQCGIYKARMVDSGNRTGPNIYTYYSSVISLHSMHTVVFLYEMNNIDTCTGDISNPYLTTGTTEKIEINSET